MENYQDQIESVAAHAKAINFDIVNGDMMDLMKSWLKSCVRMSRDIDDNKNEVKNLLKFFM